MTLVHRKLLHDFKQKHADAKSKIETWESLIEEATWQTPHEMKNTFPSADPIGGKNAVFNICGNKYRLWVIIDYEKQIVLVKNVGTHTEYDKWKIK